LLPSLDPW